MAAAALPVVAPVADIAVKQLGQLSHDFMAWASKPFYQNTRTTTRTWTERDKNGKDHYLSETKTRGFSISNGMVFGVLVVFVAWEVGLAFAKAWGSLTGAVINGAEDLMNLPQTIALDAQNAVVGFVSAVANAENSAAQTVWDWLDGSGGSHSSPPPTAVKTATMPPTAMTALSQLFIGASSPLVAGAQNIGTKITAAIQNPPSL